MTSETLKLAQDMLDDIKETERFIGVLNNGYINTITGWDYSKSRSGEQVVFTLDGELRTMVVNSLQAKLDKLKAEFENL
jgi:hypothetical protein